MLVRKTTVHGGITLAHGSFRARETVHHCAASCRKDGRMVSRRQDALAELLAPRSTVGYDVMTYVGCARFLHFQPREKIRADLMTRYAITLSTGEISELAQRFPVYFEALHHHRADRFKATLAADGGWPMHVDATGEDGRGTLLVVYAGWRGWVLGAWKIPTERSDAILPRLRATAARFGTPCAIMRDLGRAVIEASTDFVAELQTSIPNLGCHFHFVRDIGKDLLGDAHDNLRAQFRRSAVRARLRTLARDLGRGLGTDMAQARHDVEAWMAQADGVHHVPIGRAGLGVTRALAQWVLDYPDDGTDLGFPFDVPYLDLYQRCRTAAQAVEAFLMAPPADAKVHAAITRLHHIVIATRAEPFALPVRFLESRRPLLTELRHALRVEVKANAVATTQPNDPNALAELREVKAALGKFENSLRQRRPKRGPAQDTRDAIDLILTHLDRHGTSLWGHAIPRPPELGGGVRLVERTNIILENFFGRLKRGERKRSGRKNLAADFEHLPAAAALARNLEHPDYVHLLCGTLEQLPRALAALDNANRSTSLPARHSTTANGADCDVASASMPREDRQIIRSDTLLGRILGAVHSRAPRLSPPGEQSATVH
jgi:hypothetical protein